MRYTPDNITHLAPNEIFVFGSNEAGIHGAGAARLAYERFGAEMGVGYGIRGQSVAIPTKDAKIQTLLLREIQKYVDDFLEFADCNRHLTFLVTKIGCGLAGYEVRDIAPMFFTVPPNVILPREFHDHNEAVKKKVDLS